MPGGTLSVGDMELKGVVIVGNGISRLLYDEFIRSWPGEVWGCNRAYKEFSDKLTRLTGHTDIMLEAAAWKKKNGAQFEILGGHQGRPGDGTKLFTCPPRFRKDSGTTLVAQAYEDGWPRIYVVGFDLGGMDVHSPGIELQPKHGWVECWRAIARHYDERLERVTFIGYNHKPFILSEQKAREYQERYMVGKPHINDKEYIALFKTLTGYRARGIDFMDLSKTVKVKYLRGPSVGWETQYKLGVALKLEERGEIKILDKPKEPKDIEDNVIDPDMKVAALRKIAEARGIEGWESMKKKELFDALKGE